MRLALDAMGGDHAPGDTVRGAVEAARRYGCTVLLVGQEEVLRQELAQHATTGLALQVVPASEVVAMGEHPVAAVRAKKNSSLVVALNLLKSKEADAVVSAGNTGAVMAAALFGLGRIPGVERPALGVAIPTLASPVFIIDVGANVDCRPNHLLAFAEMGSAYMERVRGIARPRVGLLSNGEEASKGNVLVQEAHALLRASGLNFVGNLEGKDVAHGGADVLVTDGFVGNIVIKWSEGLAEMIFSQLRQTMTSRLTYKLAAMVLRPALRQLAGGLDYTEYGGAPLLGVDGVVIIAHGRSRAPAIRSALRAAERAVEKDVTGCLRAALAGREAR